jgi:hypothetical protein
MTKFSTRISPRPSLELAAPRPLAVAVVERDEKRISPLGPMTASRSSERATPLRRPEPSMAVSWLAEEPPMVM